MIDPSPAPAQILVLGPVAVRVGEQIAVPTRVLGTLIGALALAGPPGLGREALVNAVWAEDGPDRHRSSLTVTVHRARQWLRSIAADAVTIRATPLGYALDGAAVDADRFTALTVQAQDLPRDQAVPVLAQALGLWRGDDPLEGTQLAGVQEAAAQRLRRSRLAAAVRYGRELVRQGRAGQAVETLTGFAVRHPLDERIQGAMIEALAASGNQSEALRHYEQLRLRLAEELGVDPSVELSDTVVRVLRGDHPAQDPMSHPVPELAEAPAQLPPGAGPLAGRTEAMTRLDEYLRGGGTRVVAVVGVGGVGKTALALRWAHRVADQFPDGQLYLDLRGYSHAEPVRPVEALGRFLRALGVPGERVPVSEEEAAALYRSLLFPRRMLVMLDNAYGVEQVRPLLPGSPSCLVLVTSRDRLDGLTIRDGAGRIPLDVLTTTEATAMVAAVLGEARLSAEPHAAAELVGLCGHLPLALRVSAASLATNPHRSIAEQVTLLREDRLGELSVAGDPASSVAAVFDLSYRRLSTWDRKLFRLLGSAPGVDIAATAAAVLGETTVPATRQALRGLVAAHLLEQRGERYAMHDLISEYARGRDEDTPEERVRSNERLCRWYAVTAEAACRARYVGRDTLTTAADPTAPALRFADGATAGRWLADEVANLLAVVRYAATSGTAKIARNVLDALQPMLDGSSEADRASWDLAARTVIVAATQVDDQTGLAAGNRALANTARYLGDMSSALEHYQRALGHARAAGWIAGESSALNSIAILHGMTGDLTRAVDSFRAIIEHGRIHGALRVPRQAKGNLAVCYSMLGRLDEAVSVNRELLNELRAESPDDMSIAITLINLADGYRELGRLDEAERVAGEALDIARDNGMWAMQSSSLETLARMRIAAGDPEQALRLVEDALELVRRRGYRWMEEILRLTIADAYQAAGRYAEAAENWADGVDLCRESGNSWMEARGLAGLALAYDGLGDRERALPCAQRAVALAHRGAYRLVEAHALVALALVHLHDGRPGSATTHLDQALRRYRECGTSWYETSDPNVRDLLSVAHRERTAD